MTVASSQRARGARDPRGEVEVEQEILSERFAGRQGVLANDLAERRKVVDRAHAGCAAAMRAASRSAAIRLDGLARPLPAMSKAVPWSGEVRMNGSPSVTLTASSKAMRLDRDQRLIVIHADRAVIGLARGVVEHGVGRQRSADLDALAAQDFDGGRHDGLVLGAERAVFAGVGIEAGHREARMGEAEAGLQIRHHDAGRA